MNTWEIIISIVAAIGLFSHSLESFSDNLKEQAASYSKRVQKIEKGHAQVHSMDEMTIYELKNEIEGFVEIVFSGQAI